MMTCTHMVTAFREQSAHVKHLPLNQTIISSDIPKLAGSCSGALQVYLLTPIWCCLPRLESRRHYYLHAILLPVVSSQQVVGGSG